jgi:hypothetical protein
MAHQQSNEPLTSPNLGNSYGLEAATSEHSRIPAPQVAVDAGASAPQVVSGHQQNNPSQREHQFAHTNDRPVEYYANPNNKPDEHYTKYATTATTATLSPKPPGNPPHLPTSRHQGQKILGLSRTLFWVLAGLVVLVILGVALGAGLGVGLSNTNRNTQTSASLSQTTTTPPPTGTPTSSPTTSSTTTSTSSAPVTSGTIGLAANSCNFTQPKTYYTSDGTPFTEYCFTDWPQGRASADNTGKVVDLMYTTVYTFEDCIQRCLDYNGSKPKTQCMAVTYNSNLTSIIAVGRQGGNCFLKNKRAVNLQGSAESACAALAL